MPGNVGLFPLLLFPSLFLFLLVLLPLSLPFLLPFLTLMTWEFEDWTKSKTLSIAEVCPARYDCFCCCKLVTYLMLSKCYPWKYSIYFSLPILPPFGRKDHIHATCFFDVLCVEYCVEYYVACASVAGGVACRMSRNVACGQDVVCGMFRAGGLREEWVWSFA